MAIFHNFPPAFEKKIYQQMFTSSYLLGPLEFPGISKTVDLIKIVYRLLDTVCNLPTKLKLSFESWMFQLLYGMNLFSDLSTKICI